MCKDKNAHDQGTKEFRIELMLKDKCKEEIEEERVSQHI